MIPKKEFSFREKLLFLLLSLTAVFVIRNQIMATHKRKLKHKWAQSRALAKYVTTLEPGVLDLAISKIEAIRRHNATVLGSLIERSPSDSRQP